jgi:hypothetical protein
MTTVCVTRVEDVLVDDISGAAEPYLSAESFRQCVSYERRVASPSASSIEGDRAVVRAYGVRRHIRIDGTTV